MPPEMLAPSLAVDVECYAGYRGEETPRRFWLGGVPIEVVDIVDRWLSPDHRYFKVRDMRGDLYILRDPCTADRWELTCFLRRPDRTVDPEP